MVDVSMVEVRLLDGVRLLVGGTEVELRGDRTRALLARLALDRGSAVSRDVLIDDVWDGAPGKSGAGALRVQVKRLRDQLSPLGIGHVIETTPDGYRLVEGVTTDVDTVEQAIADATGEQASAAALFERFTQLARAIRGRPLDGLEDLFFAVAAAGRLTRLQTVAATSYARVCLAEGRAEQAESLLVPAMGRSPTDEGLTATYIDVLTALGRNRDALAVAHRLRSELAEVGLVPGDDILQREQAILNPAPAAPVPVAAGLTGRR